MKFSDFIFNYKSCLSSLFNQKKYLAITKRFFLLPYKYIISTLRDLFINKNIDKISQLENIDTLDEYFKYFDCDKSSLVHGYNRFYIDEFEKFKNSNLSILEFGIHFGSSQAAFCKYFVNSKIIGVDKNPYYKKFFSKKIRSLYCDVSDQHSLYMLKKYIKNDIDIIIDDASHIPEHQLKTFIEMFDVLKNQGIYVIEELDVFKSFPEIYNKNSENDASILRDLLHCIKDKNYSEISKICKKIKIDKIAEDIEWVKIFRGSYIVNNKNVSEIAFVKKK